MANKYTRKGKQQVPVQDEFVSFWGRAYEFIVPHLRTVGAGIVAAVVVIIAAWITTGLREGAREDATETFGRAVKMYEAELLPADDAAKPEAAAKEAAKDAEEEVPRFKTAAERASAVVAELEKIEKGHRFSKVSRQALIFKAGVLYDTGKYTEAEAAWHKFLDGASKGEPMRPLAHEGVGLTYEARGQLDPALTAYKELETSGGEYFRDRGLLDQARVLAKKGDRAAAEKIYKDLIARTPPPASTLREEAQSRLALLGG